VHTHMTLLAEAGQVEPVIAGLEHRNVLLPAPAGHIGPATALLRLFIFGFEGVFLDRWDAERAIALIQRHQIGWSLGVPTFLSGLVPAAKAGRIPTLRLFIVGGTSVPPVLIEDADAAGIRAVRSYGSSEHPTISQGLPHEPVVRRSGTDGRLCPGVRVRIVDEEGSDVPSGQPGEIVAYGPEQFAGYYDAALNEAAFTSDGGFKTGDVGVLDEDGYLTIVDRKKDIIIRGGENLSSREIEEALAGHPAVLEAAAVAWPDARLGERVGVFVQLRPGAPEPSVADLRAHFDALGIGLQKVPEYIVAVPEFPRNAYGKILKAQLRVRAAALQRAGPSTERASQ
jgi:cyclohexanecarboxylate-CoA ligase